MNAASCLELGLCWLALLIAGLVLSAILVLQLQRNAARELEVARAEILLRELGSDIEARLRTGKTLGDSSELEPLMVEAFKRAPWLLEADVFSPAGTSLFNTDRGLIGERAPQAWVQAASAAPSPPGHPAIWRVRGRNPALGIALADGRGGRAGYLSLIVRPLAAPETLGLRLTAMTCMAFACLAWLLVLRAMRARLRSHGGRQFAGVRQKMELTGERLELTLARLSIDQRRVA